MIGYHDTRFMIRHYFFIFTNNLNTHDTTTDWRIDCRNNVTITMVKGAEHNNKDTGQRAKREMTRKQ